MNTQGFAGRLGFFYSGQYKPSQTITLSNGLTIVEAGWGFVDGLRQSFCYLIPPVGLSEEQARSLFRDWLSFHDFVMGITSVNRYDRGDFVFRPYSYAVEVGQSGDESDCYMRVDFNDVAAFLFGWPPAGALPKISYRNLFDSYQVLDVPARDSIEWLASSPFERVGSRRPDSFTNSPYWELLHLVILLERLIGTPPTCTGRQSVCEVCGREDHGHYAKPYAAWLAEAIDELVADRQLTTAYVSVIQRARKVRHQLAHSPHFDRSEHVAPARHGVVESYDHVRAIAEYKDDSAALLSLMVALLQITRAVLVYKAFGYRHFKELPTIKSIRVGGPGAPSEGG